MSGKEQRRIHNFVMQSIQQVLKEYEDVCNSNTKRSVEEHWHKLTHSITILRRRLSKLETHAYEMIDVRFGSVRPPKQIETKVSTDSQLVTSIEVNEEGDDYDEDELVAVWLGDHSDRKKLQRESGDQNLDFSEPEKTSENDNMQRIHQDVEKILQSDEETDHSFPIVSPSTPAAVERFQEGMIERRDECIETLDALRLDMEKVMDDLLTSIFDTQECDIPTELAAQLVETELAENNTPARLSFPLAIPFTRGSKFEAKILTVVSPLEFYIVKRTHVRLLEHIDKVLDRCRDLLVSRPIESFESECACLVLVEGENHLYRATIKFIGNGEAQVYLIDHGRTKFVAIGNCFKIPKYVANIAPPLAQFCSMQGADSRSLDSEGMLKFHELTSRNQEVVITAVGEKRSAHGQLVEMTFGEI